MCTAKHPDKVSLSGGKSCASVKHDRVVPVPWIHKVLQDQLQHLDTSETENVKEFEVLVTVLTECTGKWLVIIPLRWKRPPSSALLNPTMAGSFPEEELV